ncbi:MAG: hypothetical protein ACRDKZ_08225 [Actinomycetota bacterium]
MSDMHSMMRALATGPVRRGLAVMVALTPLGVVVAHVLSYYLVYDDPHQRARVLDASGHGYFDVAVHLSLIAAVTALLGIAALTTRRRLRPEASDVPRFGPVLGGLIALQIGGFTGLEVLERAGSGSLGGVLHEPALLVALPLLVLGATITAGVVSVVVRTARNLASRLTSTGPRQSVVRLERPISRPSLGGEPACAAARAPPRSLN